MKHRSETRKQLGRKGILGIVSYVSIGIIISVVYILTGTIGISQKDKDLVEQAYSLQEQVDQLGFEGFCLEEIPIALYDGSKQYVFKDGEITSRKPIIDAYVGTAYPVDGIYEVFLPTFDHFSQLVNSIGVADALGQGNTELHTQSYGESNQIAAIWHEAVHAYEMTNYLSQIERITTNESSASVITEEVDRVEGMVSAWEEEMEVLKNAIQSATIDSDDGSQQILRYLELEQVRQSSLSESAKENEAYFEAVEGLAYYVESKVYQMLQGKEAYQLAYLSDAGQFEKGTTKYYVSGMLKYMLLDEIDPDWKSTYDFNQSLNEVIRESLQ